MPKSTLLTNCCIINPYGHPGLISNGYIFIENGSISAVGEGHPSQTAKDQVDMQGKTVLPGLINAHTHLYSALAMGMPFPKGNPATFVDILEQIWWLLDRALDRDSCRASFETGLLDNLRNGVTTVIDHHSSPNYANGSLSDLAEIARKCGVNLSTAFEITDRNGPNAFREGLEENLRFYHQELGSMDIRPLIGLHASFTLSDESLQTIADAIKTLPDWGIHVHVSEAQSDEVDAHERGYGSVVDRLNHFGLLNANSVVAHGVHLSTNDVELLSGIGAMLIHNPTSNANNRVGLTPGLVLETLGAGLGTDGMQGNILGEVKEGSLIRNSHLAGGLPGVDLLEMLFKNNPNFATRLFGKKIGRLEPGYQADLAFYDSLSRTELNETNWTPHLLYGPDRPSDVMTRGTFRIRDGKWVNIPANAWLEDGQIQSRRLWVQMEKY